MSCQRQIIIFSLTLLLISLGLAAAGPKRLEAAEPPALPVEDDLALAGLADAAATSLEIMARRDGSADYQLCGERYTLARLREAQAELLAAARQAADPAELLAYVQDNFFFCRSGGQQWPGKAFLTGYYTPEVAGSLEPDQRFHAPLYSPPPDLTRHEGREGRWREDKFVPYWSRAEIENNDLLAGRELVYLDDPLAAFVLQVQGSGRVRLPDGTVRPVQYAARNGREYRSIGRLLIREGKLTRAAADLPGILNYLRRQPPAERRRVLHHNESYIFFHWGDREDPRPLGSFGQPLTAGRSVALDQRHYPPGIPAYLAGIRPLVDDAGEINGWRAFGRLVFNHDSGSAIQGRGRVDLYWGEDRYAAIAAGVTRHPAEFFLLLPRES